MPTVITGTDGVSQVQTGVIVTADIDDGAVTAAKINSAVGLGITMADQWRLTSNLTSDSLITPVEQVDEASFGNIGSSMSESSGIFTFPETGIYFVTMHCFTEVTAGDFFNVQIQVTTDNSNYDNYSLGATANITGSGIADTCVTCSAMIDVTDTTQVKVRFSAGSISSGTTVRGSTNKNETAMTFIRLGDT